MSPAEVSAKAFAALLEATLKSVGEGAANLGKEAAEKAKTLGTEATSKLQKAGGSLTDLIKK
jgi:hypothetical protein